MNDYQHFAASPVAAAVKNDPILPTPVAEARRVEKRYGIGPAAVQALRGVDLTVAPGEFVAIMGPSGSGKSTLMNCMAGLDSVTSGSVSIAGNLLDFSNDLALTELRRSLVGFVFQSFNLVPTLDVVENIQLPFLLAGHAPTPEQQQWTTDLLRMLSLSERASHRPAELSGGQRQRAAIARALVSHPAVVFADEPTGSLDGTSSREVLELMRNLTDQMKQSIVMVTHNPVAASFADRIVVIADGTIVRQMGRSSASEVSSVMISLEQSA